MAALDYVVLVVYFVVMTLIGILSMLKVKKQEDFFLGSRVFGKLFQSFAAFGAGTGSQDPVAVGRTTYTSGLSGIWSVLLWLFVTPFYWFTAVWYRRMRHITMGDWFVERYQSKALGGAYMLFSFFFYAFWLGVGFAAIGKVGAPLLANEPFVVNDQIQLFGFAAPVAESLVCICAAIVLIYAVLGGLRAAYWTDVIQGVFIILLSVLLIPMGLRALADEEARITNVDPQEIGTMEGFRIMHERVPDEYFKIVGSSRSSDFPLYYILAITILNLVAIVVHPHMAVTGGGSARSENSARVGLVTGNFMKRFCTIGWSITILIVLAYMAGNTEIAEDPDKTWGVAAREILGPYGFGLVGLMLACLMAALMSSASAYMLVVSGLVVRNFWAPFINPNASEKTYVRLGRVFSAMVIVGGVIASLMSMDVFGLLKEAWALPIVFASVFWVGMFWRRATKWAAWGTVLFSVLAFYVLPWLLPILMRGLDENPKYSVANDIVTRVMTRHVVYADVKRREAAIELWEKQGAAAIGPRPELLKLGETIDDPIVKGGKAIFWTVGVEPIGEKKLRDLPGAAGDEQAANIKVTRQQYDCPLRGKGWFNVDFVIYDRMGLDMTKMSDPALNTLRLPTRVILPFVVMILLSLITPRVGKAGLDRYYVKMKTPVNPDPEADQRELAISYEDPSRFDHKRLVSRFGLEMQRPNREDIVGFVVCFLICFALIGLTIWLASIGS
ncbi:MAG: sodium:solute symporter family protein [Planctomycetes bacterium]|nr:sodium:solute symporter family protein [Planctomycetota bacterium]